MNIVLLKRILRLGLLVHSWYTVPTSSTGSKFSELSSNDEGHRKLDGIQVTLKNADLWRRFCAVGTEMIITKTGRRMFPSLVVDVSGLEPDACYFITLEMCLSSSFRYKFDSTRWVATGRAEMQPAAGSRLFIHPDSPATGSDWMNQPVSFQKVKLTNNSMNRGGQVLLSSMQKYIPKVSVVKASDVLALQLSPSASFSFPETEFIAVTAYQNESITKLKIDFNPFAKGFRENGKSHCKRKSFPKDDTSYPNSGRRRCYSEQSCTSSLEDSGLSSLGSASPAPEDLTCDRLPHPFGEQRLDPHLIYPYRFLNPYWYPLYHYPFPYHPLPLYQPTFPQEEPQLIDLSLGPRDKAS